jgi:hypothetical protein
MRSHQLTPGRMIGVTFNHGDDFYLPSRTPAPPTTSDQGFISVFITGFSTVEIVGTCQRLEQPEAPVWDRVHLSNVEALGGGTIAYDPTDDRILPQIHVSVGLKQHSATGHISHLLDADVQFAEMLIIEIAGPAMRRVPDPALFDVPLPHFRRPRLRHPAKPTCGPRRNNHRARRCRCRHTLEGSRPHRHTAVALPIDPATADRHRACCRPGSGGAMAARTRVGHHRPTDGRPGWRAADHQRLATADAIPTSYRCVSGPWNSSDTRSTWTH